MEREDIIKVILGERCEEGREIANIVLDYVEKHPDWKTGGTTKKLYKNSVLNALNQAIYECYGHDLEYYSSKSRKREFVDVRQMAMYLYHEETGFSLNEVGEIFNKHHSTVIFAYNNVKDLIKFDRGYARDFKTLKESFKKYL